MLPAILAGASCGTRLASRTGHLPRLPVNVELTAIVGLLMLGLPGDVRTDRANERSMEVPWTLHEQGRIHIAGIDDGGFRGKLLIDERLVDWLGHGDIRDGGFRRL